MEKWASIEMEDFSEEFRRDKQEMSVNNLPYEPHLLAGFKKPKQGQMGEN